jgi:hypothetical protein
MNAIIIENSRLPRLLSWFIKIKAITIFPFIFIDGKGNKKLVNHEKIHIEQYKELFIIGFLILYLYDWLKNLIVYRDLNLAYKNIRFEKEAYTYERYHSYLSKRKKFSWKDM